MATSIKILQPEGILDGAKANDIRRQVSDMVSTGTNVVLIDLAGVREMDSGGLGGLVAALKVIKTVGGNLYLCSLAEPVKRLFTLANMDRVFKVFGDRHHFIRYLCD
jgi:anti-anti-sigma factor